MPICLSDGRELPLHQVQGLHPLKAVLPRLTSTHKELQHRPRQIDPELPKQSAFHKCLLWLLTHNRQDGS